MGDYSLAPRDDETRSRRNIYDIGELTAHRVAVTRRRLRWRLTYFNAASSPRQLTPWRRVRLPPP